eukprot:4433748-Prymnesium_polylepis.1
MIKSDRVAVACWRFIARLFAPRAARPQPAPVAAVRSWSALVAGIARARVRAAGGCLVPLSQKSRSPSIHSCPHPSPLPIAARPPVRHATRAPPRSRCPPPPPRAHYRLRLSFASILGGLTRSTARRNSSGVASRTLSVALSATHTRGTSSTPRLGRRISVKTKSPCGGGRRARAAQSMAARAGRAAVARACKRIGEARGVVPRVHSHRLLPPLVESRREVEAALLEIRLQLVRRLGPCHLRTTRRARTERMWAGVCGCVLHRGRAAMRAGSRCGGAYARRTEQAWHATGWGCTGPA